MDRGTSSARRDVQPDKASSARQRRIDAVGAPARDGFKIRGHDEKADRRRSSTRIEKETVRSAILDRGIRPDGRGLTEIRPITVRGGRAPTHPWLGPIHPRSDAGAQRGDPRHHRR